MFCTAGAAGSRALTAITAEDKAPLCLISHLADVRHNDAPPEFAARAVHSTYEETRFTKGVLPMHPPHLLHGPSAHPVLHTAAGYSQQLCSAALAAGVRQNLTARHIRHNRDKPVVQ
jgi:hypothetical protein